MENNNNTPRRPNPRRRRRSRMKVFKQVYLPVILVGLVVLLFILFAINSINRSNNKREEARRESIAAEESRAVELAELEEEASALMVEADLIAQTYDYEAAIAVLDRFSGNIYDFPDLLDRRDSYVQAQASLVAWDDPGKVVNLGFHLLIADSGRAFSDSDYGTTYKWNLITTTEFSNILSQLYKNDYVLVDFNDIVETTVHDDGTVTYAAKTLYLPAGKTPFMISQTQVNYYTYMTDGDGDGIADRKGDGFASRLVLDKDGKLACEYVSSSGDILTGDYDLVPILETFIEEHPDFSYQGARATIAVCGYDGIFGYRTDPETATKISQTYYDEQLTAVPAIIQALQDAGYTIACNTYGNVAYGDINDEKFQNDLSSWEAEVTPILGDISILAYAKNSDIAAPDESYSGTRFEMLQNAGFRYYLGFCEDGTPWIEITDTYVRQGRLMVTGSNLKSNGTWFEGMFETKLVIDNKR